MALESDAVIHRTGVVPARVDHPGGGLVGKIMIRQLAPRRNAVDLFSVLLERS
jgi:hypothetical protein